MVQSGTEWYRVVQSVAEWCTEWFRVVYRVVQSGVQSGTEFVLSPAGLDHPAPLVPLALLVPNLT